MAASAGQDWVAAVDLGGSLIKSTLAAPGRLDCPVRRTARTGDGAVPDLLRALADSMADARSAGRRIAAAGVAVPGVVDDARGYVVRAVNLGIENLDLRALLERDCGVPVYVGHDIRCAGNAEYSVNAGSFGQSTMVLPVGTGVAAALMVDGRPVVAGGYAGEIGHLNVGSDRPCACGLIGCLETVSSARAVSQVYQELSGEAGVAATDVAARAARTGSGADAAAMAAWHGAVEGLAVALAATSAVLGLDAVIVAGGLSLAGDRLIAPLTESLYRRLSFHRRPRLSVARLGADAGCRGAALGAMAAAARATAP